VKVIEVEEVAPPLLTVAESMNVSGGVVSLAAWTFKWPVPDFLSSEFSWFVAHALNGLLPVGVDMDVVTVSVDVFELSLVPKESEVGLNE
jgi:hypothetical protein